HNVSISGVVAVGATGTGSIARLPGHPVERVTVENVRISTAGAAPGPRGLDGPQRETDYPEGTMYRPPPAFGLYLRHARDLLLRDVELRAESADERPALVADDVTGLHLAGLRAGAGNGDGPVVWLNDVRGALVHGNLAPENVGVFLRVSG